jgi:hypothetical protein
MESARKMDRLTKWEQTFLENLLARFRVEKSTMVITKKMWRPIAEISNKVIN